MINNLYYNNINMRLFSYTLSRQKIFLEIIRKSDILSY